MKKAFLMMLFVFSIVIAGCGEEKAPVPENPNDENIGEMEGTAETPEDPGAGGEGENSSDG